MESLPSLQTLFAELDCGSHLYWAPIRHHSPTCSYQLQNLIEAINPEVILVEGPSEANHLIKHLFAKNVQLPVAFYSFVVAKHGLLGSNSRSEVKHIRYRGYVPMSSMSPEYVALEKAHLKGIESCFYRSALYCPGCIIQSS